MMGQESWLPFLEHFSSLMIYGRLEEGKVDDRGFSIDDPRISVIPIPFYDGIADYFKKSLSIRRFLKEQIQDADEYYAMWVPSQITPYIANRVSRVGAPLLTIAIGDPAEVSKSIMPLPLKSLSSWISSRAMRVSIQKSSATLYVTLRTLQEKYPPHRESLTLARSDVRFGNNMGENLPRYKDFWAKGDISLVAVGSQEQNYKGHDLLIQAVANLQREGYPVRLTLVGQGALHGALVSQASEMQIRDIAFLKHVGDSQAVANEIAQHDIFVMPSRTEGMPKALLEAMHTGTLCIGSSVGGIPEVLEENCLFERESVESLVARLRFFLDHPGNSRDEVHKQFELVSMIKEQHSGDLILSKFLEDWKSAG